MRIRETRGCPYSTMLTDGTPFRLTPRETKYIEEGLISESMKSDAQAKIIAICDVPSPDTGNSQTSNSAVNNYSTNARSDLFSTSRKKKSKKEET